MFKYVFYLSEYDTAVYNILQELDKDDDITFLYNNSFKYKEYFSNYNEHSLRDYNYSLHKSDAENKYDALNELLEITDDGDVVVFIDDGEIIDFDLKALKSLVELNPDVDVFFFPRINIHMGLSDEDIQERGWERNGLGWVNFPDYQPKVIRSKGRIQWVGKTLRYFKNSLQVESSEMAVYKYW